MAGSLNRGGSSQADTALHATGREGEDARLSEEKQWETCQLRLRSYEVGCNDRVQLHLRPQGSSLPTDQHDRQKIALEHDAGDTYAAIGERYGITHQRAQAIVREATEQINQIELELLRARKQYGTVEQRHNHSPVTQPPRG